MSKHIQSAHSPLPNVLHAPSQVTIADSPYNLTYKSSSQNAGVSTLYFTIDYAPVTSQCSDMSVSGMQTWFCSSACVEVKGCYVLSLRSWVAEFLSEWRQRICLRVDST